MRGRDSDWGVLMISLVWRTDVHLSDTAPSSRKDDWAATVLGKLDQVGRVADKVRAAAVLDGGDFFHVKSPSRNTHDLVRRTADLHAKYPCPVYANVGNHDCVYGDIEYLDQQPLGVLFSTGVFKRCYGPYEVYFGPADRTTNEVRAYPRNRSTGEWSNGDPFFVAGLRGHKNIPVVRVVGIPYHGTRYDMSLFDIKKGKEDHLVVMAHVLASPSGGTMFEGEDIVKYDDLASTEADVYFFGHWHQDQGVTDLGSKKIVNVGSLTRGSLTQDEVQRRPACVVADFDVGGPVKIRVVRLRVASASDVFDVEGRAREVTRVTTMDSFVQAVKAKLSPDSGDATEEQLLASSEVPDKVRERVLSYLERA